MPDTLIAKLVGLTTATALLLMPIGNIFIFYTYISTLTHGHNVLNTAIDMSNFGLYRVFRDMGTGAAFYPLLIGMPLLLASFKSSQNSTSFRNTGFILLISLLFWIVLSGTVNFSEILNAPEKIGRSGAMRFALQLLSFSFFAASYQLAYLSVIDDRIDFFKVSEKVIRAAFWLTASYALIVEIPTILGVWDPTSLIAHLKNPPACQGRVQGLTAEPSWLGVYLAFATPWLLFKLKRSAWHIAILSTVLATITFFTFSRTSYVIVFTEIIVAVVAAHLIRKSDRKHIHLSALIFSLVFVSVSLSHKESKFAPLKSLSSNTVANPYSTSNKTRIGTQIAGLKMAEKNPFFGVGLGQASFQLTANLPDWALKNNLELQEYFLKDHFGIIQGLHPRIIAETGLVGFGIWLALWVIPFIRLVELCKTSKDIGAVWLLSLLTGVFLSGFVVESFKFFESSFTLAFAWGYISIMHNGRKKLDIT